MDPGLLLVQLGSALPSSHLHTTNHDCFLLVPHALPRQIMNGTARLFII